MGNIHKHFPIKLLLPCFLTVCLAMPKTSITTDQSALLALKAHITDDPSQILEKNWTLGSTVCDWIGVTCGLRHFRVTALDVSFFNLTGTVPPHLGNLSFLVSLDMRANKFQGGLPNEFSQLRRLKLLRLGNNNLSGWFPPWIGSLHELEYLFLNNNSFSGVIPPSISNMSKLAMSDLSFNSLQGNIPVELFNISSLEKISLAYNSLSGSLPDSIFLNLQRLSWISISWNEFNGLIPSSIGQCLQLRILSLSYNKFTGEIPKSIGNLRALVLLALGANQLEGTIPETISNLTILNALDSGMNNLTGEIPKQIGNLTMLTGLYLDQNYITGVIPREMSNLYNIREISFAFNKLTGLIPTEMFNFSTVTDISLEINQLVGDLPSTMGYGLPNLEQLYLGGNNIGGAIPYSISNCSKLWLIDFPANKFTGPIPNSLGDLTILEVLNLEGNNLMSDSSSLSIITSLTNCKYLRELRLAWNPLSGILPYSVGNLSTSLEWFELSYCKIRGTIPSGIGNLSSLIGLYLNDNLLIGPLPSTIKGLQNVQEIDLSRNRIGNSLQFFCACKNLEKLALQENNILGSIPGCLGNVTRLRYLYLSSNKLNSSPPENLWNLKDLMELNLSSNLLSGSFPSAIQNLKMASLIDLSRNNFEDGIPSTIGTLQNLQNLSLAHNKLQGSIPETMGKMLSLERLDLSHNFLSGFLPMSLETLRYLTFLNVSFNNLSGEIPSKGPFINFNAESFISNDGLCGDERFHVPPCPSISAQKVRSKKVYVLILVLVVGMIIVAGSMSFVFVCLRYRRKVKPSVQEDLSLVSQERISYYKLVRAIDGYNESNLLGTGGFGSVYKGTLEDGRIVAVKVFNLQIERSFKSFDAECEVLRNFRHRNLTKVISSCSNTDFKALVLEYMPNGSLEKWLYSHNYFLNIMQRMDILIDVACALQYLHCENSTPIVHCDLKPRNVLLDQAMVAHVSDFGIAKLLSHEDSITYTKTLATLGYLAPEYGLEGLVSTKCDVYSFGIMIMEVFTRMRPNNEMFGENLNLRSWVQDSLPNRLDHIIDVNLLRETKEKCIPEMMVCISSIMEVALTCTKETPRERNNIQFILSALNKIKLQLQPHKESLEGFKEMV